MRIETDSIYGADAVASLARRTHEIFAGGGGETDDDPRPIYGGGGGSGSGGSGGGNFMSPGGWNPRGPPPPALETRPSQPPTDSKIHYIKPSQDMQIIKSVKFR